MTSPWTVGMVMHGRRCPGLDWAAARGRYVG